MCFTPSISQCKPRRPRQAGVDLGTVLAAHQARSSKAKKKKKAKSGGKVTKKAKKGIEEDDDSALQLRPKRRAPISEVLLVGGATRMPAFRTFVTNMTGLVPRVALVDPDEVS